MFCNEINSNDNVFTNKYNEISNNATYLHIIDSEVSTNYDILL